MFGQAKIEGGKYAIRQASVISHKHEPSPPSSRPSSTSSRSSASTSKVPASAAAKPMRKDQPTPAKAAFRPRAARKTAQNPSDNDRPSSVKKATKKKRTIPPTSDHSEEEDDDASTKRPRLSHNLSSQKSAKSKGKETRSSHTNRKASSATILSDSDEADEDPEPDALLSSSKPAKRYRAFKGEPKDCWDGKAEWDGGSYGGNVSPSDLAVPKRKTRTSGGLMKHQMLAYDAKDSASTKWPGERITESQKSRPSQPKASQPRNSLPARPAQPQVSSEPNSQQAASDPVQPYAPVASTSKLPPAPQSQSPNRRLPVSSGNGKSKAEAIALSDSSDDDEPAPKRSRQAEPAETQAVKPEEEEDEAQLPDIAMHQPDPLQPPAQPEFDITEFLTEPLPPTSSTSDNPPHPSSTTLNDRYEAPAAELPDIRQQLEAKEELFSPQKLSVHGPASVLQEEEEIDQLADSPPHSPHAPRLSNVEGSPASQDSFEPPLPDFDSFPSRESSMSPLDDPAPGESVTDSRKTGMEISNGSAEALANEDVGLPAGQEQARGDRQSLFGSSPLPEPADEPSPIEERSFQIPDEQTVVTTEADAALSKLSATQVSQSPAQVIVEQDLQAPVTQPIPSTASAQQHSPPDVARSKTPESSSTAPFPPSQTQTHLPKLKPQPSAPLSPAVSSSQPRKQSTPVRSSPSHNSALRARSRTPTVQPEQRQISQEMSPQQRQMQKFLRGPYAPHPQRELSRASSRQASGQPSQPQQVMQFEERQTSQLPEGQFEQFHNTTQSLSGRRDEAVQKMLVGPSQAARSHSSPASPQATQSMHYTPDMATSHASYHPVSGPSSRPYEANLMPPQPEFALHSQNDQHPSPPRMAKEGSQEPKAQTAVMLLVNDIVGHWSDDGSKDRLADALLACYCTTLGMISE